MLIQMGKKKYELIFFLMLYQVVKFASDLKMFQVVKN